ncbi:hypothetical protein EYF80_054740 [Liparis tanakae]|uniref:Uncharacterized protein n=1 Tax=Liparis tanakae TaxID=230148 RepID=A0A4Z2F2H9_9TELE|nr:hypothetical protein EYF80_054740 [Liparis tanakae]
MVTTTRRLFRPDPNPLPGQQATCCESFSSRLRRLDRRAAGDEELCCVETIRPFRREEKRREEKRREEKRREDIPVRPTVGTRQDHSSDVH